MEKSLSQYILCDSFFTYSTGFIPASEKKQESFSTNKNEGKVEIDQSQTRKGTNRPHFYCICRVPVRSSDSQCGTMKFFGTSFWKLKEATLGPVIWGIVYQ